VKHIVVCGHYDCALIRENDANEVHGWHKYEYFIVNMIVTNSGKGCDQATSNQY
jgi:carbonic anhydrase